MGQDPRAEQRLLITQALEVVACDHFALAGSGAIREHGLTDRSRLTTSTFSQSLPHSSASHKLCATL